MVKDSTKVRKPTPAQQLGARGEALAVAALIERGYTIVATDVRYRVGQIDIIARDGADLVFVEVKTRRSQQFGTPTEAITPTKQRHMLESAQTFLLTYAHPDCLWRIDVVTVLLTNGPPQIEIFTHAING